MTASCSLPRSPSPPSSRCGESRPRLRALVAVASLVSAGGVIPVSADAAAHPGPGDLPSLTLHAPVDPFSAARLFIRPGSPWGPGHRGIDLDAATGSVILAPGDGLVTFAGVVVDRGVVTVDHGGTLRSSVEPITPVVRVGDHVRAGDPLGEVSDEPGHCAPATCVHWGVRLGGDYVNPLDFLVGYGRIVLLP
jgi:murein DD-endopeptidase MepM/ murein hydrolase activator NlpD